VLGTSVGYMTLGLRWLYGTGPNKCPFITVHRVPIEPPCYTYSRARMCRLTGNSDFENYYVLKSGVRSLSF
jgi:hypothetical protein